MRTAPAELDGVLTDDLLAGWTLLIDRWAAQAHTVDDFRWSESIDCEVGEYLLHGLERCIHSPSVQARITEEESQAHRPFTAHLVEAFVVALEGEGRTYEHYTAEVRALLESLR